MKIKTNSKKQHYYKNVLRIDELSVIFSKDSSKKMTKKALIEEFANSVTSISFLSAIKSERCKSKIFFSRISPVSGYQEKWFSICENHPKFSEVLSMYLPYRNGRHLDYSKPNIKEQDKSEIERIVLSLFK